MLFREKYQRAWELSSEVLRDHSLTHALSDSKLQHWLAWSGWYSISIEAHQLLKGEMAAYRKCITRVEASVNRD